MSCTLIAIEGPDKVGKETQSNMLVEALRQRGFKVSLVEVPYNDGMTYRLIYRMLKSGSARDNPNAFQFVQFLNKLVFQLFRLPFLKMKNDYVVFDRWSPSAIVYGRATGTSDRMNDWLCNKLTRPDATVVLMGPSHKAERVDDSYEKDSTLQTVVRMGYKRWVENNPLDSREVSCIGSRIEVHDRLLDALEQLGAL